MNDEELFKMYVPESMHPLVTQALSKAEEKYKKKHPIKYRVRLLIALIKGQKDNETVVLLTEGKQK